MPTLDWIGKKAVVGHHREVPFHLLKTNQELSVGEPGSGNLLVQGDNLLALKALLPYYAGQIKCICIDPPYNTGEEHWAYNDNVNSPEIRRWLSDTLNGKTVDKDDLSRHDKWLCMMMPRLKVLKDLLSRDGIIAVTIDDNEIFYCGQLMDEIFGSNNRLACAPWLAEPSGGKQKTSLRSGHEYVLIYHNGDSSNLSQEERSAGELDKKDKWGKYRKGRELLKWGAGSLRTDRPKMWFPLRAPNGSEVFPIRNDGMEGRWRMGQENPKIRAILEDLEQSHWEIRPFDSGVTCNGKSERWVPYEKVRNKKQAFGWSTWLDSHGFNSDGTRELKEIFGNKVFDTPKPVSLIKWIISLHEDENAIILDSFTGSGTTGHAVLQLNKEDGGTRRVILVEMDENICRNVTAERLKRVCNGYTKPNGEQVEGLGGGFRYCELGEPLFGADGSIRREVRFHDVARHVFFTETGEPLPSSVTGESPLIGVAKGIGVYLLYNGILGDKSPRGGNVLTTEVLTMLPVHDGPRVVYGTACRISPNRLKREGIIFRQIPYEIRVS
jgi:adenine-specific DNA-methyltransferase